MAISYFGIGSDYLTNHIRSKRLRDGFLINNDYGSWTFLTDSEFRDLKKGDLKEPALSVLKENGIVIDENATEKIIGDYRKRCNFLFQGTSLHIIVPTLRCNMNCSYCHAQSKKENDNFYDMTIDTAKKTVDFIFQSPAISINIEFQGGEPLLNFNVIIFIVNYAKEKNKKYKKDISFSIVTNLTLMTNEILDFLLKEKVSICTSLDGPRLVHNKNRGEYDKTVNWIKKINKIAKINAMPITTKHSLPYYKEIVDEYINLGFNLTWIKPVNNLGYAKENWDKVGISAEEFLSFWKKALDYIIKKNSKTLIIENYTLIILKKILKKEGYNFTDMQSPCGAAIGQMAYNYDGSLYSCDEGRLFEIFKLGTVDDKYKDVIASKETCAIVTASINDNPKCELCVYKPYCGLCPVSSYSDHGNILAKMPDRRCDIFMGMYNHIFDKLIFDERYRKVFFDWVKSENHL
jgi:His-Xaa-Ser system radical SAM maturase HxsB